MKINKHKLYLTESETHAERRACHERRSGDEKVTHAFTFDLRRARRSDEKTENGKQNGAKEHCRERVTRRREWQRCRGDARW